MLSGVRRETGWFLRCGESISPGLCFKTIQLGKGRFKCRVRSGDVPWEVQRHPPGRGEWGFCCYLWFGFFFADGKRWFAEEWGSGVCSALVLFFCCAGIPD